MRDGATGTDGSLRGLLSPRSIAVIGASEGEGSINGRPMRFLAQQGFTGEVFPVNPSRASVLGRPAYASIRDVPAPVDVALVMVRAKLVPQVLRECAAASVPIAIVVSSGFGEGAGGGAELRHNVEEVLATTKMRVIGPNCEGMYTVGSGMPLTFSPVVDGGQHGERVREGGIAVISQSGGLGFAVVQWGAEVRLGFSHVVTTGNELDVGALEVAAELVEDGATETLVLLIESVDVEGLAEIARRAASLGKRLVVVKLGQTEAGARGALAHTLHNANHLPSLRERLAGEPIAWAHDAEELVDILQMLHCPYPFDGTRVGIAGTSGGAGVWLADACEAAGLTIPRLGTATKERLRDLMPDYGSPENPVDLTAQFLFLSDTFGPPVGTLMGSGEVDAVALAVSLSTPGRLDRHRSSLAEALERHGKPLVVYTYTRPAASCVDVLGDLRIPWFTSSERVARALAFGMGIGAPRP